MIEYHLPSCAFVIRRPPQIGPSVNLTNYDLLFPIKVAVTDSPSTLYQRPCGHAPDPLRSCCLGLSHSGTESLKQALEILGYKKVYHSFNISDNLATPLYGVVLVSPKLAMSPPGSSLFTAHLFDRMIGDCDAVTDIPCAIFGQELLHAYPDAKVILNRRRDDEAWVRSVRSTLILVAGNWSYWFKCFFDAEMFWIRRYIRAPHRLFNLDTRPSMIEVCSLEGRFTGSTTRSSKASWGGRVENGWTGTCVMTGCRYVNFSAGKCLRRFSSRVGMIKRSL